MAHRATTVLAHAVGFTGASLEPVAAHIGDAVSFDIAGHGRAPIVAGDTYSWRAAGQRLLDDIAAADISAPRVGFGHSGGGVALIWAEILQPGTFESLFLYEPPLRGVVPPDPTMKVPPLAERVARRRDTFVDAADFEAYLRKRDPYRSFDDAALAGYIATGIVADEGGGYRLACPPALESTMYSSPDEGLIDRVDELDLPIVLAYGEHTFERFVVMTNAAVARIPGSRAIQVPGLTHFGPLEDPARVAAVYRHEALDRLGSGSAISQ